MSDVYLAYSSKDRDVARPIAEALRSSGISVFWDQEIAPGTDWSSWLQGGLSACKAVVGLLSKNSKASNSFKSEVRVAVNSKKLILVAIDKLSPLELPMGLASVLCLDWDSNKFLASFAYLVPALRKYGVIETASKTPIGASAKVDSRNRGYAFFSHVEEDIPIVSKISGFLAIRSYAYWTYHESGRAYQKPTVLEIEERMVDCALMLAVISPDWKRSDWTQRELAFAREIKKPLFHLRWRNPGPTLAIAGDTYFDFERGEDDAFRKLGPELDKKGL